MKKKKINVFRLVMVLFPVLKRLVAEINNAVAVDSEGGRKVTPGEVTDIVIAVLAELREPLEDLLKKELVD